MLGRSFSKLKRHALLLQAIFFLSFLVGAAPQARASASSICAQPGTWCEPAQVQYRSAVAQGYPRFPTANEACAVAASYYAHPCRAGVDPVWGRGCYCYSIDSRREFLFQNWYEALRPMPACPARAPNYADDGWTVEVANPVCYGTTTIGVEEQSCGVGNPTLPGSGTKVHSETDYAPSFSHPIPFERHYRSKYSVSAIQGQITNGWLHSYSARLYLPALSSTAYALRANGEIVRFTRDAATSAWQSENRELQLTEQRDATNALTGWQIARQSDNGSERFDKSGRLTQLQSRNGWTLTLGYNVSGQVDSVTNHFGRRLALAYDTSGRLSSITQPGGEVIRYAHDPQGNLLTVTWPDGSVKRYHYEDSRFPRALTGITDETGQRIGTYTYDAQGRVASTQRAGGVDKMQFSYGVDAAGTPQTKVTDFSSGAPTSRTYNFALQGRMLRPAGASSPCPQCGSIAQSTQYDPSGLKTREVLHDGSVVFYRYNNRGLEIDRATFPASFASVTTRPSLNHATSVISTQWHPTWNVPVHVVEPARRTSYSYDVHGITSISTRASLDATGATTFGAQPTGPTTTTQYTYNADHLNTSITELTDGVQTQRWNLAYNAMGDLISIIDVTGGEQGATLTSDPQGRLTRISASNGAVANYGWSVHGQLVTTTMPGFTATLTYDTRRFLTEVGLSTGQWLRVTYSASGEPVSVLDSTGQVQQFSGLSTHWLRSADPIGAAQALLTHSLQRGEQRLGDALVPSAFAQPIPLPIPPGIAGGLAASSGGALANRADQGPASSSCCGGAGSISTRDMQERLQRTLPFTLMATASEVMQALTDDILTMRAGAQLRKLMQCPTGAYYQPLPPGCQEAHHIVAIGAIGAQPARNILAQVGIDINSPANGVWMECGKHRRMHTTDYYNKVNLVLGNTNPKTAPQIALAMSLIRAQLKAGTF